VIRTAAMPRTGSYSTIRSFLNVYHPVFHAATMRQFLRSLRTGIRADGVYPELKGESGIPLSKNLAHLAGNPYGRPYIMVLDLDAIEGRMSVLDLGITDDVGGFVLAVRGVIHPSYIRGAIVGNRIFNMRSVTFVPPGRGSPSVTAPRRTPPGGEVLR
jgi:hypothetical protein